MNAGVVDTGGRFAPSGNDTVDQLVAGVIDSSDAPRAANIFANFRKTRNGAILESSEARRKMLHEKTFGKKSRDTVPLT